MNTKAELPLEQIMVWVVIGLFIIVAGILISYFGGEIKDLLGKLDGLFG